MYVSVRGNIDGELTIVYRQDYRLVFNTEVQIGLDKADRLMYGDSCMTHAMVFTAVGTDVSPIFKIYTHRVPQKVCGEPKRVYLFISVQTTLKCT